jgi:hypothetical protein
MTIRIGALFLDMLTFAEIPLSPLEVAFPSTPFCPDTVPMCSALNPIRATQAC